MTPKERITALLAYTTMSAQAFATAIGCQTKQTIYDILKGKTKGISRSVQGKIISYLPEVNQYWLLTGEGEMLTTTHTMDGYQSINISNSPNSGANTIYNGAPQSTPTTLAKLEERPFVPPEITRKPNLDVYEYAKTANLAQKYPAFSFFPDVELYCQVLDDSMQPRYFVGDILALAPFDHDHGTLVNGRPFVISTKSIGFIFALVYDRTDHYECRPINKDGVIETTEVAKSDVIRIYRVVGMMRLVG